MARYLLTYADGTTGRREAESYEDLIDSLLDQPSWEGCVVGHAGDLGEGGDRTLVWASADDAQDDPGAKAFCVITRELD